MLDGKAENATHIEALGTRRGDPANQFRRYRSAATLWVLLEDVLFCLKDVLKAKSRSSADDSWHAGTHMLEFVDYLSLCPTRTLNSVIDTINGN